MVGIMVATEVAEQEYTIGEWALLCMCEVVADF
jgi:hypothetical protein